MSDQQARARKVTPRQIVLMAVLAIAFGGVLWYQLPGAEDPAAATAGADRASLPVATVANEQNIAAPDARPVTPWPKVRAVEARRFDPFALSPSLARRLADPNVTSAADPAVDPEQVRKAADAERISILRKTGVSVVFQDKQGAVAIVGSREVRVGDLLDGFRVIGIESDGVRLAAPEHIEPQEGE